MKLSVLCQSPVSDGMSPAEEPKREIVPIDHAFILPRFGYFREAEFAWRYWSASQEPFGADAINYVADATVPAPCVFPIPGCMAPAALNFDPDATRDDGSCILQGCTEVGIRSNRAHRPSSQSWLMNKAQGGRRAASEGC